ncbi:MAG: ATP synthase F0 subunit B [Nitrospirae bacterium]|nr:ATP synthase F0 subunit B [Nitrospirota bacterium]
MLDIELKWLIVLLINFLVLVYILNILLFRPLLALFKERESSVKGSLDAAKEMDRKKEEGLEKMSKELSEARHKAKDAFEKLREEGLNSQKMSMAEAEAQAAAMLQKAREELKAETEKAKNTLRADAEKFSEEIVRKLVKA